ncbi:DUF4233 domain-containing protein [Luteococcus sp. Sow4_B9]|uniref:DUF4233 domain-containing protein n=1 Tax=Luteococcus sp. Sow4_B9 TaxID=3438792 RepID=UPI003F94C866
MNLRLGPQNPMNKTMVMILAFEVIVFGLGFPGMIMITKSPLGISLAATIVASLLAIGAAATLRRPIGYPLGWLTQLAGILLGLLTPWMYAMGGIFAAIWVVSFLMGRKIETSQTAV